MVIIFLLLTIYVDTFFGMKRADDGTGKDSYRYDSYELEEGADFSDKALETVRSKSYNSVETQEHSDKPLSIRTEKPFQIGKPEEPSYASESTTAKEATTASSSSHSSSRNKTLALYKPSKVPQPHKTFEQYCKERSLNSSSTHEKSSKGLPYILNYYHKCLEESQEFLNGTCNNYYHLLPFFIDKITIDEGVSRVSSSATCNFSSYKKTLQVYDADKITNKELINEQTQYDSIISEVCTTPNGVIFHRGYSKDEINFHSKYENAFAEKTHDNKSNTVVIRDTLAHGDFGGEIWSNQFGTFIYSPLLKKHFLIRKSANSSKSLK